MESEAAANMFSGQVQEASGFEGESGMAAGTRTRQVDKPKGRLGKSFSRKDSRKWGDFDLSRGLAEAVQISVTRDSQMPASEAGFVMNKILKLFGMAHVSEGQSLGFRRAMFLCQALNSSSGLQPGRAKFSVMGSEFDFHEVILILGEDSRRFFRAWADEIREEVRRQLDNYDPDDSVSVETVSWIRLVATDRGLQRHPDLISDASSGCTGLTLGEMAAIASSTNLVLSSSINAIDSMRSRSKPLTGDGFDSTNLVRLPDVNMGPTGRV